MTNKIAVDKHTALMMFWNAGYDTEPKLLAANAKLSTLTQPTEGYYLADEVSDAIGDLNQEAFKDKLRAGDIQAAKNEMLRYGKVIDLKDTSDDKGAHRVYIIEYYNRDFTVSMTNGRVTKITFDGVWL